jgi:hypothetical protein
VRHASADHTRRAARPPWTGGLLLVTLLVLLGLVAGCDRGVEIDPPAPSRDTTGERADEAQQALDKLVSALDGPRADAVALATPDSRKLLGWVHDNAEALDVDDVSLRYVDEGPALSAGDRSAAGEGAWRGTVQLSYAYAGVDESPAQLETSVVFAPTDDGVRISSFGGTDARSPLWLLDRLTVVRRERTVLAVAGPGAGRYERLVPRAVRQVRRTLPSWRDPLVVEVPRSTQQMTDALQAKPGQYDNIAAVTTTADGSLTPGSPVRVFVNPTVFGRLKDRGAQVVMSHEATHVATGATFTPMPTWLLEGFADYVALDGAGVPVDVAARQVLERIREEGLPKRLPTSSDLDPTAPGLGATYEEAWLACRFLAEEYGAGRLVRFYDAVSDGASAKEAFRDEVGTTQRAFVARWRADLADLAGVAG